MVSNALCRAKNFHRLFHSQRLQTLKYFLLDLSGTHLYNQHPRRGAHGRRDQRGDRQTVAVTQCLRVATGGCCSYSRPTLKPKGLASRPKLKNRSLERLRIKTRSRFEEMISLEVAKSLESFETSSLVARDVTGGGGKATRTKTKWHRVLCKRRCEVCENESRADRKLS